MQLRSFALAAGLLAGASTIASVASAQSSACPSGANGSEAQIKQDACQKSQDIFGFMAPQLGLAIAGGNATLGQGSTLGGLGHFTVGLRANVVQGAVPEFSNMNVSTSGAQQSDLGANDQILGAPTLEAGVGLFKGIPLGLTRVGGVDFLVNASYLPEYRGDDFQVTMPDGSFKFGYGARVGVLQESMVIPGVSVTYLRRDLPTVDVVAQMQGADPLRPDTVGVAGLSVRTSAWRVVASKKLMVIGLAVGAGQDKYDSKGQMNAAVHATGCPVGSVLSCQVNNPLSQTMTRTNYFADLSFNLLVFNAVAEVGRVSGGDVTTYNSFGDQKASDPRTYGSIGLRFGF